jgi:hypothetical protein
MVGMKQACTGSEEVRIRQLQRVTGEEAGGVAHVVVRQLQQHYR